MTNQTSHPPAPAMPRALRVAADRLTRDLFPVAGDPQAVTQVIRDHANHLDPESRTAILAGALLLTFGERLPALVGLDQPQTPTTREDRP